jgi:hypothetical protein
MKDINKGRRNELKNLKYKKRLKLMGFNILDQEKFGLFSFKSHGKPCSCWQCRDEKFRDKRKKENTLQIINNDIYS